MCFLSSVLSTQCITIKKKIARICLYLFMYWNYMNEVRYVLYMKFGLLLKDLFKKRNFYITFSKVKNCETVFPLLICNRKFLPKKHYFIKLVYIINLINQIQMPRKFDSINFKTFTFKHFKLVKFKFFIV